MRPAAVCLYAIVWAALCLMPVGVQEVAETTEKSGAKEESLIFYRQVRHELLPRVLSSALVLSNCNITAGGRTATMLSKTPRVVRLMAARLTGSMPAGRGLV